MTSSTIRRAARAVLTTFAAGAVVLAAGCAGSQPTESAAPAPGEPTTLSLWGRDSTAGFLQDLADAYNKAQDQVKVEVTIVSGDFGQKFSAAVAGGEPPDVTSLDLIQVPYYAEAGALTDLSDRVAEISDIDDFSPGHVATSQWNGAWWALPFNAEASVLYYNKDLFRQAGLDPEAPPTTWAEMTAAAEKISALGNGVKGFYMSGDCGGCNLFVVSPYLRAAGADLLATTDQTIDFSSQASIDAITFLNNLWTSGYMPEDAKSDTGANFYSTFATGTIGMQGGGAFGIKDLIDAKQVDFGTTLIPGPTAGSASSFAGGDNIVIPAGSAHLEEAWDFVLWATGADAQKVLADQGVTPVRMSVAESYYSEQDPRLATLVDALKIGSTPVSVHTGKIFGGAGTPWATLLQNGVFGNDPAAAAAEAQAAAEALIK